MFLCFVFCVFFVFLVLVKAKQLFFGGWGVLCLLRLKNSLFLVVGGVKEINKSKVVEVVIDKGLKLKLILGMIMIVWSFAKANKG